MSVYRIRWANGSISKETYSSATEATLDALKQIRYILSAFPNHREAMQFEITTEKEKC